MPIPPKSIPCIYARTLDENFEQAADILLDMVFNSALRDRDISTEKGCNNRGDRDVRRFTR